MSTKNRFEERYKTGDTPWDHAIPDVNLINIVTRRPISKCRALDVGCGTGDNAIWLAKQDFSVIGCDISPTAIEEARKRAFAADVNCSFIVADFLSNRIPGSSFGFVFDRGCLHSVGAGKERRRFAKNVSSHLEKGGLWLSITGNADEHREFGPPQLTARDLVLAVEPYFEIISLFAGHFGSNQSDPPRAWVCLMQERDRD
jgi:SAM-dependent methyltransferase